MLPVASLGEFAPASGRRPAVAWLGDSIATKAYPTAFNLGTTGGGVFLERMARDNTFNYIKIARGSRKASGYLADNTLSKMVKAWVDYFIIQFGIDEGSTTVASHRAIREQICADARARGVQEVVGTTITPSATSTDGFATAENQTYRTNFGPLARSGNCSMPIWLPAPEMAPT